jgi:heat shock factor-binding protein 1
MLITNQSVVSNSHEGSGELTAVVDDLLNQLNNKFTTISSELLAKSE